MPTPSASAVTDNRVAVATLPPKSADVKPWEEGALVTVHHHGSKGDGPFTYYFADGRRISIEAGQSGEVPDNVAAIFTKSSGGKVSLAAESHAATDANSKLAIERARSTALEHQLSEMQAKLAELEKRLA